MGKAEGLKELWHGHVTAVTVAPDYRRIGVAKQLMESLESVSAPSSSRWDRLAFRRTVLCHRVLEPHSSPPRWLQVHIALLEPRGLKANAWGSLRASSSVADAGMAWV